MNNKILPVIILSLLFGGVVFAQDTELPDPGWTPDSFFYFLESIAERVVTFLTFGDIKKAERHTALAAERLAETNAVAEKGKMEFVERSLKRYEDHLLKASLRIERAKSKGENTEQVTNIVAEATQKHRAVLEKALEGAPEEAKPAIRHAMIVSTKEGLEMVTETASDPGFESLKARCIEEGQEKEICEKLPSEGFGSFEALETFCTEAGGPPEMCPALETQCREFGVTTANECFRVITSTNVKIEPSSQPLGGQSFEVFNAKCLESGAPAEMCASIVNDLRSSKSLRTVCVEKGAPSEVCEQLPSQRFESFEAIEAFCTETGGPPEICSSLKAKCLEFGVTTPNECFLVLSIASITTFQATAPTMVPARSLSEEEMEEMRRTEEEIRTIKVQTSEGTTEIPVEELQSRVTERSEEALAKCLNEKGVKFYGSKNCGYCIKQKEMFGDAVRFLPYIECTADETRHLCTAAGIGGVPAWDFPGKERAVGLQSLEQLAELSGCSY